MKTVKKLWKVTAVLVGILLMLHPAAVLGAEIGGETVDPRREVSFDREVYINPVYRGMLTEADLAEISEEEIPLVGAEEMPVFTTLEDAAAYVREMMKKRTETIELELRMPVSAMPDKPMSTIFKMAQEHTGDPCEGDYFAYQHGGMGGSASIIFVGNIEEYMMTIDVTYFTSAQQEEEVTEAVRALVPQLTATTDYDKLCNINEYICRNVDYDYAAANSNSYDDMTPWTAYGALIKHKAVCQGYAALFYRLALELGLDARIVDGIGKTDTGEGDHAWNIVCVDGCYYYMDVTWNENLADLGRYRLRGSTYMSRDHELSDESQALAKEYDVSATDYVPETEHHPVFHPAVPATCETDGYASYYSCSTCERLFSDAECTQEIFDKLVIHAKGHIYGEWTVSVKPTCTTAGMDIRVCARDASHTETRSVPATGHRFGEWTVAVPASCESAGKEVRVCANDASHTEERTIPATGHRYGAWTETVPASCESEGEEIRVCANDASHVDRRSVSPTGHDYGDWEIVTPATEEEEGLKRRICRNDPSHIETQVIPRLKPYNPFVDVSEGAYYYQPVLWALKYNVTSGTDATHFSPKDPCTRGQVVTFLWRAAGSPEPTSTVNPFTDVVPGKYYYKAVLWAVENKITSGLSATLFGANDPCTRGQVVTFLHRARGAEADYADISAFTDVYPGKYYYEAVRWAVKNNITSGTSATTFSPNETCSRGQIVTFLYRAQGA